jgi:hypothetical protein
MSGAIERAERLARVRFGRLTPFRVGLMASKAGLAFNPYPKDTHKHALFEQGAGVLPVLWPCGHLRTQENTQTVGCAGVRCRECRRRIARESARRAKARGQ